MLKMSLKYLMLLDFVAALRLIMYVRGAEGGYATKAGEAGGRGGKRGRRAECAERIRWRDGGLYIAQLLVA